MTFEIKSCHVFAEIPNVLLKFRPVYARLRLSKKNVIDFDIFQCACRKLKYKQKLDLVCGVFVCGFTELHLWGLSAL